MLLSELNQYDLTGTRPEFKKTKRFVVYAKTQLIDLGEPAYVTGLIVKKESDGSTLSVNTTADDCKDVVAISDAKLRFSEAPYQLTNDTVVSASKTYYKYDASTEAFVQKSYDAGTRIPIDGEGLLYEKLTGSVWNQNLISRFYTKNSSAPATEYVIVVTYQALRRDVGVTANGEVGPDYSPALMRSVVRKLDELLAFRNMTSNAGAATIRATHQLEEDLTGVLPDNYIQNEPHYVNVPENRYVIHPLAGSFYLDGLELFYTAEGSSTATSLSRETGNGQGDYEVIGVNKAKTAVSDPACGVYDYIVLKKSFVGTVTVTYHAFGGEINARDIDALYETVQNLANNLTGKSILTAANIGDTAIIANILDHLDYIDHSIHHYKSQTFLYTPQTYDTWVDIAFIPKHPWFSDSTLRSSDTGKFEILFEAYGKTVDLLTTYDLTKNVYTAVDDSSHEKANTHPDIAPISLDETKPTMFSNRFLVKFRYIGKASVNGGAASNDNGIMLQMSAIGPETGAVQTRVRVTDKTSARSPWQLIDSSDGERFTGDNNDGIFPNGATWTISSGLLSNPMAIFGSGYTIFAGSIPMSAINYGTGTFLRPDFFTRSDDQSYNAHVRYDEQTEEERSHLYGDHMPANKPEDDGYPVSNVSPDLALYEIPERMLCGDSAMLYNMKNSIRKIRFRIWDCYNLNVISVVSDVSYYSIAGHIPGWYMNDRLRVTNSITASALYYADDLCHIRCHIHINQTATASGSGNRCSLSVVSETGTNSLNSDRFTLIGIDVL